MNKIRSIIGISALVFVMVTSCLDKDKGKTADTYIEQASNEPCLADPAWFQVDPISGKRKTPAPKEDRMSVFGNNVTVTNCDFHQWSWQKFLWLTNDVSGNPLFMDRLFQVDAQAVPVPTIGNKIMLSTVDSLNIKQATGNVLKTNKSFNSNNKNYDIFYSIHVDSSLYKSIHKYASLNVSDFKDSTFPVGALELKIAWVNVNALRDISSYFVTEGKIDGIDTQIALLGMHVVGIVYNHPEFIWATFEHRDLSPYYDWTVTTIPSDSLVRSNTNYLLFDSTSTGTLANITLKSDSTNVFAVNKYGVPRQAGNTFLQTSQKEPENYDNIEFINNSVQGQLRDVWNNYFYNGSIWINTEGYSYPTEQAKLLDSLTKDSLGLGYAAPLKLPRGSVAAYNITMETYEQLGFRPKSIHGQNTGNLGNCFSCHIAQATYYKLDSTNNKHDLKIISRSALNISHIFNGAVDKVHGYTAKETKQKHLDEIEAAIKKMK